MNCMTNSSSDIFFNFSSDIFFINNSISISVNNSNFTSVFFKAACHANPGAEKNLEDLNDKTSAKSNASLLR